jgi:hypothetical protein
MDRDGRATTVRMAHDVVAAGDAPTLNPTRVRPGRRARRVLAASGDVDGESQLVGNAELGDKAGEGLAQVGDSSLWAIALSIGSHARAQLSVSTPHAVFVLVDGVWDMHVLGHCSSLPG